MAGTVIFLDELPYLQFWFGPFAAEECLMMAVDPRGGGGVV